MTFEHGFLKTTATGEVQPTLLPGVVLTENTLTVLNPTPVSLELELDPAARTSSTCVILSRPTSGSG